MPENSSQRAVFQPAATEKKEGLPADGSFLRIMISLSLCLMGSAANGGGDAC